MPHPVFVFGQEGLSTFQRGSLRLGRWQPTGAEKEQVVLLPGRGDFLEKYTPLATFLNARGYNAVSLDWPGQGASRRLGRHLQAGHIDSYDDYVEALRACLEFFGLEDQPQAWVAYSMGAPVAMQGVLKHAFPVKGLVLLSPAFGFAGLPEGAVRVLANLAHGFSLTRRFALGEGPTNAEAWQIEDSQVSSNEEAFAAFKNFLLRYPDYLIGGSTWGWVRASLQAFEKLRRANLSGLRLPVLLLSAQAEATVSQGALQLVMQRLPNAQHMTLPGKHDLLLSESEEVEALFHQVADFLNGISQSESPRC